jgi:hypothetical protein
LKTNHLATLLQLPSETAIVKDISNYFFDRHSDQTASGHNFLSAIVQCCDPTLSSFYGVILLFLFYAKLEKVQSVGRVKIVPPCSLKLSPFKTL